LTLNTDIPKKKPLGILFANLKGNIGDFAILEAMVDLLIAAYPGREIVVHPHPLVPVDKKRLEDFLRQNPAISISAPTYSGGTTRFQDIFSSLLLKRGSQAFRIRSFVKHSTEHFAPFSKYEAVFMAGGDQWSGRELGVAMFGTLTAIHRLNTPVFSFPFSLKSSLFGLYSKKDLTGYFNKLSAPLIVRDSLSKGIIDAFLDRPTLGADCVYSLNRKASAIAPAAHRNPERTLYVVKAQEKDLAANLENLVSITDNLELFTTCPPEDSKIYRRLAESYGLPYHEPGSWQEIIAEFKACKLIVTNRLHGLILGSLAETPLLPVTTRKKSLAFARDANIPHSAATVADITTALIEKARKDHRLILENMNRYADECRSKPHSPAAPNQC